MRAKFFFRYFKQASRLHSWALATCSEVGGGLGGRGGFNFFWYARWLRFRCNNVSLFLMYHSCFNCLAFSGSLLGISRTQLTPVLKEALYLAVSQPIIDLGPGFVET